MKIHFFKLLFLASLLTFNPIAFAEDGSDEDWVDVPADDTSAASEMKDGEMPKLEGSGGKAKVVQDVEPAAENNSPESVDGEVAKESGGDAGENLDNASADSDGTEQWTPAPTKKEPVRAKGKSHGKKKGKKKKFKKSAKHGKAKKIHSKKSKKKGKKKRKHGKRKRHAHIES